MLYEVHPALPIVYSSGKNERERSVTEVGREGGGEEERGERGGGREQRYTRKLFAGLIVIIGGIHMIFPFSRNGPANYKFSLFSKLPTNYPKISEKIQKTYVNIPPSGIFGCVNYIFSENFG